MAAYEFLLRSEPSENAKSLAHILGNASQITNSHLEATLYRDQSLVSDLDAVLSSSITAGPWS